MKKRLASFSVCLFAISTLCGCAVTTPQVTTVVAEQTQAISVSENVAVPMRDGVNLMANVFRPEEQGEFPVIVMRTPYGKGDANDGDGRHFAANGYVYVVQDCRGTGKSEGDWYPGVNEGDDGRDTHQWILAQPWCDGSIGTTGASYLGYTQWITAPDAGEHLKAMFTIVPFFNWYDDCAYIGGTYHLGQMMGWGSWMAKLPAGHPGIDWDNWKQDQAFLQLPLATWDDAMGFEVDYMRDWVAHPEFDDYWKQMQMTDSLNEITSPNITISGWYDIFVSQALENVESIKNQALSPLARDNQYMVVGPWAHGMGTKVGEIEFGEVAKFQHRDLQNNWFDHWLKGDDTDVDGWAPLRIFVMGINQWRDENEWPLERTEFTPYYFNSMTGANSAGGDGTLSIALPADGSADKFVYDPANPVPTHGGCNLSVPAGAFDQSEIEKRNDVLVYTSDVLDNDLEVTGPVKAVLYAASSATDTDWTTKLVDVYPDGKAMNICDGVIRARYRDGGSAELIEPGKVYRYEIDLWATSNVFLKGHRLRVEISSSNFPRFDRNPNTGHKFGADAKLVKANQEIYHDKQYPSHILLPIIP